MINKKHWKNFAGWFLISLLLVGCNTIGKPEPVKTVIPPRVVEKEISWDGNTQDAGVIAHIPGKGFHVTPKALARYMKLVDIYGPQLVPPVSSNDGVSVDGDDKIFLTNEAMVRFAALNQKHKNGLK